jgi:hypothetical protein
MSDLTDFKHLIRDFIQHPRRMDPLIQNKRLWFQLTSAIDTIEDTEGAIEAYLKIAEPTEHAGCYLLIYGILQVLFVQQDAVYHLAEAFDITLEFDPELHEIREIRNCTVGHPTAVRARRKEGKLASSHYIVQVSVTKTRFQFMSAYEDGETTFQDVDIMEKVERQRAIVTKVLQEVWTNLQQREQEHRDQFKGKKLIDVFPPTLNYMFEKASVATRGHAEAVLGSWAIEGITQAVCDFEAALGRRGILHDSSDLAYYFEELEHPMTELQLFMEHRSTRLDTKAAAIYLYFIQRKVDDLQQMAREIDAEYAEEEGETTEQDLTQLSTTNQMEA